MDLRLTVVFDNETSRSDLECGWGFSCLVEAGGERLLFDTGCDGPALRRNLEVLGINPKSIGHLVLSHFHWDHTGGLFDFLDSADGPTVYVPASFSDKWNDEMRKKGEVVEVSDPVGITENGSIRSLGEQGERIKEQSLLIKTKIGNVVLTGCAHPGIPVILSEAEEFGPVRGLFGGFHGFHDIEMLNDLEILGPCHCTQKLEAISQRFPEKVTRFQAGAIVEF